jgi:MFS family permease
MKQPFSLRTAFVLGMGFLGITVVGPITNNFVPIFLKEMGLSATLVGFVMTWDNYLNLLIQPIVGERSDHTRTRFGRRKPWIMIGAPVAAIGFTAIPLMPTLAGLMGCILLTNFALALFRSPAVSLLGDMFPQEQRSAANGIVNLMGGLGAILAFWVGGKVYDAYGRPYPFLFGSVVMLAMLIFVLWWIHEPETPTTSETEGGVLQALVETFQTSDRSAAIVLSAILCWSMGYAALEAWLSSFGKYGLGIEEGKMSMLTTVMPLSFMLAAIPSGLLATRFGRRRIILLGVFGLTGLCTYGLFIRGEIMLLTFLILVGIFWAFVNINALPLVYDTGGQTRFGALTGLYYLAGSIALITGPPIVGGLVDWTGGNYHVMFAYSGVFMLLAGLLIYILKSRPV